MSQQDVATNNSHIKSYPVSFSAQLPVIWFVEVSRSCIFFACLSDLKICVCVRVRMRACMCVVLGACYMKMFAILTHGTPLPGPEDR